MGETNSSCIEGYFSCTPLETVVEYIVSNNTFKLLLVLCILFSIGAIVGNLLLIIALYHSSLIQTKVKLLLVNVSTSAVILCISEIIHKSLIIIRTYWMTPKMISGHECLFEALPKTIAIYSLGFSMVFVALERAVATKNFRSYETQPKFLAWICVSFCWVCPTLVATLGVFHTPESRQLPFCFTGLMYSSMMVATVTGLDLALGLLSLFMYAAIIYINQRKLTFYMYNQAQLTLSGRFQLRNNIEMSNILIASVVLRVVTYAITDITFMYLIKKGTNVTKATSHAVMLCSAITVFHCQIHPISMLIRSRKLRSSAKVALCRGKPTNNAILPEFRPPRNANGQAYLFDKRPEAVPAIFGLGTRRGSIGSLAKISSVFTIHNGNQKAASNSRITGINSFYHKQIHSIPNF